MRGPVFWVDPTPHSAEDPIETTVQTASGLVEAARSATAAGASSPVSVSSSTWRGNTGRALID